MKILRSRPFLCLAFFTVLLGVLWHSPLGDSAADHSILRLVISIIGAPFIASMRLVSAVLGDSIATPLVGLLLGLSPYLLADWLWRKRRATHVRPSLPGV